MSLLYSKRYGYTNKPLLKAKLRVKSKKKCKSFFIAKYSVRGLHVAWNEICRRIKIIIFAYITAPLIGNTECDRSIFIFILIAYEPNIFVYTMRYTQKQMQAMSRRRGYICNISKIIFNLNKANHLNSFFAQKA